MPESTWNDAPLVRSWGWSFGDPWPYVLWGYLWAGLTDGSKDT
jgi:hypothetical protein